MSLVRVIIFVVAAGAIMPLGGCQSVGPIEIGVGRDRYNSVLQSTGKVQTLANIVRVKNNEQTSFLDVTEVDAGTTLTGTLSGNVSGIGSRPGTFATLGSITPGVTYTEAPFIRYIPLVGQGLVGQLVTPVGVDALDSLVNSSWSSAVVLDLAAAYMAPDFRYDAAALNIISLLADDYQTATLVAGKSDLTTEQSSTANQARGLSSASANSGSKPAADDTLTVFRQFANPGAQPNVNERTQYWWRQLLAIYRPSQQRSNGLPLAIELRTVAIKAAQQKLAPGIQTRAPVLKTYSALGIVQNAVNNTSSIAFVSPEQARQIRDYAWNNFGADYYVLPPTPENLKSLSTVPWQTVEREGLIRKISEWIQPGPGIAEDRKKDRLYLYEPANKPSVYDPVFIHGNVVLLALRRYVLIVSDDTAPPDAYVAYSHGSKWYYIAGDDEISKKNFNLISLFLTVMAVPSSTAPVGTSINVGG